MPRGPVTDSYAWRTESRSASLIAGTLLHPLGACHRVRVLATVRPPMAPCPDENTLLALVEGKLSRLIATPIQRHIEKCRSCQIVSAEAARTVLSDVVVAPP